MACPQCIDPSSKWPDSSLPQAVDSAMQVDFCAYPTVASWSVYNSQQSESDGLTATYNVCASSAPAAIAIVQGTSVSQYVLSQGPCQNEPGFLICQYSTTATVPGQSDAVYIDLETHQYTSNGSGGNTTDCFTKRHKQIETRISH